MSQRNGEEKFYSAFIKIHLISFIWTGVTLYLSDLLTALFFYLFTIHLLAGVVHLYGARILDLKHVFSRIRKAIIESKVVFRNSPDI